MGLRDWVTVEPLGKDPSDEAKEAHKSIELTLDVLDRFHSKLRSPVEHGHVRAKQLRNKGYKPIHINLFHPNKYPRTLGFFDSWWRQRSAAQGHIAKWTYPQGPSLLRIRIGQVQSNGLWNDHVETSLIHEIGHSLMAEAIANGREYAGKLDTDDQRAVRWLWKTLGYIASTECFEDIRNVKGWYQLFAQAVIKAGGPEAVFAEHTYALRDALENERIFDKFSYLHDPNEWFARLYSMIVVEHAEWDPQDRIRLRGQLQNEENDLNQFLQAHRQEADTKIRLYSTDELLPELLIHRIGSMLGFTPTGVDSRTKRELY